MLITRARLVPVWGTEPKGPVDVLVRSGKIAALGSRLPADQDTFDADGRWLMPGFWDHHVHFSQWAEVLTRFDTSGAHSPEAVCEHVSGHVSSVPDDDSLVVGFGHRVSDWYGNASIAQLDQVSGQHPVVLVSGDAHSGWLNSAAQRLFGVTAEGIVSEDEWFGVFTRLPEQPEKMQTGLRQRLTELFQLGVVGLVDLVMDGSLGPWRGLTEAGVPLPKVRIGVFPAGLERVIGDGLRSGDRIHDLLTMGPLKIIGDGSVSSVTAACHEPYGEAGGYGELAYGDADLAELFRQAARHGLDVACHAIGDAAVTQAVDAFAATGAVGSIEHAQLVRANDVARMARYGIAASVQPWHLVDDIPAMERLWPDRGGRCFPLRSLVDAGVELRFGSDAPVAPLDPLGAVAAAVHRNTSQAASWHPEEAITTREALQASVDRRRVASGQPADLVLLDENPLADGLDNSARQAEHLLRLRPVAATIVAGEVRYRR